MTDHTSSVCGQFDPFGPPEPNRCPTCGGKKERAGAATCYGCYLDGFIPAGYEEAEDYRPVDQWGDPCRAAEAHHYNATRRPPLGVALLDETRRAARDQLLMCRRKPQMGHRRL